MSESIKPSKWIIGLSETMSARGVWSTIPIVLDSTGQIYCFRYINMQKIGIDMEQFYNAHITEVSTGYRMDLDNARCVLKKVEIKPEPLKQVMQEENFCTLIPLQYTDIKWKRADMCVVLYERHENGKTYYGVLRMQDGKTVVEEWNRDQIVVQLDLYNLRVVNGVVKSTKLKSRWGTFPQK